MDAQKVNWLVLPGSQLEVTLRDRDSGIPLIEVTGNPRGMASLASILLWLASYPEGHEFVSLTALPFIRVHYPLSLSVELAFE